ncbi:TPA: PilL N-terminal domain-containing protein [Pseudomonas aeruginosa]|nr:PilL N-terminal domain-containing protein [Pseudomonas aeruginosa]
MRPLSSALHILLLAALAAGCTTPPLPPSAPHEVAAPPPEYIPVVRYGRYTLVELTPTAAQHDLLLQVVDVSIPDTLHASVGDALRHVLRRSGYQLCAGRETDELHALPLPAAHYHLGPLQLRDALLALAGPARTLHVEHAARRVCFSQSDAQPPAAAEGASAPAAEEPQP